MVPGREEEAMEVRERRPWRRGREEVQKVKRDFVIYSAENILDRLFFKPI